MSTLVEIENSRGALFFCRLVRAARFEDLVFEACPTAPWDFPKHRRVSGNLLYSDDRGEHVVRLKPDWQISLTYVDDAADDDDALFGPAVWLKPF